jgi:hypothetical protein
VCLEFPKTTHKKLKSAKQTPSEFFFSSAWTEEDKRLHADSLERSVDKSLCVALLEVLRCGFNENYCLGLQRYSEARATPKHARDGVR